MELIFLKWHKATCSTSRMGYWTLNKAHHVSLIKKKKKTHNLPIFETKGQLQAGGHAKTIKRKLGVLDKDTQTSKL
jgi:hypothetical protein